MAEFYPYMEKNGNPLPTIEDLLEFLKSPAKARRGKDPKTPTRFLDRRRTFVTVKEKS